MNSLTVNSPAKLNLFLYVDKKRKDRFHNIITLFERIDLADRLTLASLKEDKIEIVSDSPDIPLNQDNIVFQAARIFKDAFDIKRGVRITIKKRIPVSRGLGGGSSNAAATLLGLARLWRVKISRDRLMRLGRALGADVGFFLSRTSFALGEGRGDRITAITDIKNKFWHVLLVPEIRVPTRFVYERFDHRRSIRGFLSRKGRLLPQKGLSRPGPRDKKLEKQALTIARVNVKMLHNALKANDFSSIGKNLWNGLEGVSFRYFKKVRLIKKVLEKHGLSATLMSGSGSSVFSLLGSRKEAQEIKRRLDGLSRCEIIIARTY